MIQGYLAGLPNFLIYFVTAVVLLCAFIFVYTRITPHDEFALLRDNNAAAAMALLGATFGFAFPLASTIANSVSMVDFVLWALIAAIVQIATFMIARMILPKVSDRIIAGEVSAGAWVGGMSATIGLLNAACLTY